MHYGLLDRNFHTPSLVCSRSPFLLTTGMSRSVLFFSHCDTHLKFLVCSIASRFYTAKPDLHPRLTELAKSWLSVSPRKVTNQWKFYKHISCLPCGAVERYEQVKTWLLLGMAIR